MAEACAQIARTRGLSLNDALGAFVRQTLLEASARPEPQPVPERDAAFDQAPSWGSPAAIIDAAIGLITLARKKDFLNEDLLIAIENLSNDPVPAVRFQIARSLTFLHDTAHDLMWEIAERMSAGEPSRGVLQALLSSLSDLAVSEAVRVAHLTKRIFSRVLNGPGAEHVRELCVGIFTALYIWKHELLSAELLNSLNNDPCHNTGELSSLVLNLRQTLTYDGDDVRGRSLTLLKNVFESASAALHALQAQHAHDQPWTQPDIDQSRSAAHIIDDVTRQIYYGSGAFTLRQLAGNKEPAPTEQQRERLYKEAHGLLTALSQIGIASIAHQLLETLRSFIAFDPPGVFLSIGDTLRAAKPNNYQYEQLAAALFVRLVERYLSDYAYIFQERDDCRRALLDVLDIFVAAGWPNARRLTFRLEELFR